MKLFLTTSDHSVTHESFELFLDPELQMLVTIPQPSTEDIDKYYESESYISHTDSDRSFFDKAYQIIKKVALRDKVNLIRKLSNGRNLLDIGAGTGDFIATAKQAGWNVSGVEPSAKARGVANRKNLELQSNTQNLPSNSFDVITMWHVLEHVHDLDKQISELRRLLKPDGRIVIGVPNFRSLDANIYGRFWAAYDVPRHLWHFSKRSVELLFGCRDFIVERVRPMKFDAYYVCLLSEKYKTGKMNVPKAFYNAFRSNLSASRTNEYSSLIYIIKNK